MPCQVIQKNALEHVEEMKTTTVFYPKVNHFITESMDFLVCSGAPAPFTTIWREKSS